MTLSYENQIIYGSCHFFSFKCYSKTIQNNHFQNKTVSESTFLPCHQKHYSSHYTTTHTSKHNSVIEHHIVETYLILVQHTWMPSTYWSYSFVDVMYDISHRLFDIYFPCTFIYHSITSRWQELQQVAHFLMSLISLNLAIQQ